MTGQRWHQWCGDSLELRIRARTRCPNEGLGELTEDALQVRVNAPPVEGKANKRIQVVLAAAFGVAKSRVQLIRGNRSPYKWYRIDEPSRVPQPLQYALGRGPQVDQTGNPDYE